MAVVQGVASFSNGSSVVAGYFGAAAATFGEGELGETVLTRASIGSSDAFVARFAADGTLSWARATRAVGFGSAFSNGIASFADGSSVATGSFGGSVTFGPGEPGETTFVAGGTEAFVAQYAVDGTLSWATRVAGSAVVGDAVASFSDGSAVVTGEFYNGSATFGPGEAGQTVLTATPSAEVFVARYRPDGSLDWARRAGGANDDQPRGIASLPDGSSVVTGAFLDTATFGAGDAAETSLVSESYDVFVARYAADGTLLWAKRAGGPGVSIGRGVASFVDGSSVVAGDFNGPTTFGPGEPGETQLDGSNELFVARYNADGSFF